MSHPHNALRQHRVERSRVAHITRGYASGGGVSAAEHDDEKQDRKLIKKVLLERDAQAVEGSKAKERMDRPGRKRGGRSPKHKGNNVNVIVAPQGHAAAPAVPAAIGAGAGAPPMPAPRPPVMAGPPPGGPPGLPPGAAGGMPPPGMMPPGGPIRATGGRAYAKGGGIKRDDGGAVPPADEVKSAEQSGADYRKSVGHGNVVRQTRALEVEGRRRGASGESQYPAPVGRKGGGAVKGAAKYGPGWTESDRLKTPVQHAPGKDDQDDVGRGKPITYATGGPVEHPLKGGMGPKLPGGAGGGKARLAEAHMAKRSKSGMAP